MNILFISAWYPHRYDSMEGLFVQKHAEAASLYAHVKVLYVQADDKIKEFEIVVNQYNNVEEYRVYYPFSGKSFFGKIRKTVNYFRAYVKGFAALKKTGWKPDVLHANVLTRTVFIAYLYKLLTKTPYVVTEHWTRLLKSVDNFNGTFRKIVAKTVVKNAGYLLPVSKELLDGMEAKGLLLTNYEIVENVVDECFYKVYPAINKDKPRILNVTCFLEKAKNLFGLLRTVKKISEVRDDFELVLIGEGKDLEMTYEYYNSLNFSKKVVIFAGLKTSEEVAELMQNADFVIQFSNYESAGVVVQEALVSGLPVISTKVGVATDFINETNGLLVEVNDEKALYDAINRMLDNLKAYEKAKIKKEAADKFSYEHIGARFRDIYLRVLNKTF